MIERAGPRRGLSGPERLRPSKVFRIEKHPHKKDLMRRVPVSKSEVIESLVGLAGGRMPKEWLCEDMQCLQCTAAMPQGGKKAAASQLIAMEKAGWAAFLNRPMCSECAYRAGEEMRPELFRFSDLRGLSADEIRALAGQRFKKLEKLAKLNAAIWRHAREESC